ncbi:MAG TPA: tripartite tricarboxylate transporter substrate binding protein [Bordetella sp.]|nr:tripartite tricarboxylate transporter substrate binding protein [Bordetella sp.]
MQVKSTLKFGGAALGLFAALLLPAAPAAAQSQATLTFVVPFTPGGGNDILARILAPHLSEELHRNVVVENKPGASGNIGLGFVAHSKPDGNTIGIAGSQVATNPAMGIPVSFDVQKDLAPVGMVAEVPMILVVSPKAPYHTLAEFIAYAKEHPGQINFSSPGVGVPQHLAGELLNDMAHIKLVHVPYQGTSPALADVLSGQVQATFGDLGAVLQYIKSGAMRPLGVARNRRTPLLDSVPAFSESPDLGLKDYNASLWFSLMAPAGTPKPVIDKLNAALNAALKRPDVRQQLATQGFEIDTSTPEELRQIVARDLALWTQVARENHLSVKE